MLYTMNEIDPKPVDGFSTAKLSLYGLMNVPMVQAENRKHADALFLALPQQVAHLLLSVHNVSRCLHGPISRAGQRATCPVVLRVHGGEASEDFTQMAAFFAGTDNPSALTAVTGLDAVELSFTALNVIAENNMLLPFYGAFVPLVQRCVGILD